MNGGAVGSGARVAVVDGASFVLPYDHELVKALASQGRAVRFFGSDTRYNAELMDAMAALPGVEVQRRPVSGSVTSRGRGVVNYLRLWLDVWRARRRLDVVNLQFSVLWPLER